MVSLFFLVIVNFMTRQKKRIKLSRTSSSNDSSEDDGKQSDASAFGRVSERFVIVCSFCKEEKKYYRLSNNRRNDPVMSDEQSDGNVANGGSAITIATIKVVLHLRWITDENFRIT